MTDQTAAGLTEQAIRELCIGSVEWHVSTEDGTYCMSFGYDGSINPEREAAEWLERHQKIYTHRYMDHKVRRVVVQSKLQEVALALLAQLEEQRAVSARMEADARRLDWLADKSQSIGNVQLPRACVERHPDSLRAAIDAAIAANEEGKRP
jgi:hypothetical protein